MAHPVSGLHKAKKLKQALIKGGEINLPTKEYKAITGTTKEKKRKMMAVLYNNISMAALLMARTNKGTLAMVYKAQDDKWPSGRAHLVITD